MQRSTWFTRARQRPCSPDPGQVIRGFLPRLRAQHPLGLTLVEVLVALSIAAIALLAAGRAVHSSVAAAERQRTVSLAQLCAHNALSDLRLSAVYPATGVSTHTCTQLGLSMQVQLLIDPTANPSLHRVQARVEYEGQTVLSVVTLAGRY